MESSICPKCKKKTVRYDIWDEEEVCENCGYVSGSCNLTNGVLFDGEGQRIGLQVSEGDSGMHAARMQLKSMGKGMSNEMWRELSSDSLKYQTHKKLMEYCSRLSLSTSISKEAETLIDEVLGGNHGTGKWMELLCGAAIYFCVRMQKLPLSLLEISENLQLVRSDLANMFHRLCQAGNRTLPSVSVDLHISRILSRIPQLKMYRKNGNTFLKHATLLSDWARENSLHVGRPLLPIKIKVEEICRITGSAEGTVRKRIMELKDALILAGKNLPWKNHLKRSTIHHHLPFLVEFIETCKKAKEGSKEGETPNSVVSKSIVSREEGTVPPEGGENSTADENLPGGTGEEAKGEGIDSTRRKREIAVQKSTDEKDSCHVNSEVNSSKRRKIFPEPGPPPSFIRGQKDRKRREEKLAAAKSRLKIITTQSSPGQPADVMLMSACPGVTEKAIVSVDVASSKSEPLDDEDRLIEELLLANIPEDVILDGYYTFAQNVIARPDSEDVSSLIRSAEEVEFIQSLKEKYGSPRDLVDKK